MQFATFSGVPYATQKISFVNMTAQDYHSSWQQAMANQLIRSTNKLSMASFPRLGMTHHRCSARTFAKRQTSWNVL